MQSNIQAGKKAAEGSKAIYKQVKRLPRGMSWWPAAWTKLHERRLKKTTTLDHYTQNASNDSDKQTPNRYDGKICCRL